MMQWGIWYNMIYTFQRTWHIMALGHLQPPKIARGQTLHASTLWRAFPFPGRRPTTQPEKEKPRSCMNSSHGQHLPTTKSGFWILFRYSLLMVILVCFRYVYVDTAQSLCQRCGRPPLRKGGRCPAGQLCLNCGARCCRLPFFENG